jgi:hypothetical protein
MENISHCEYYYTPSLQAEAGTQMFAKLRVWAYVALAARLPSKLDYINDSIPIDKPTIQGV